MLLAIDVGNTNTAIGLFQDDNLITDWRLATDRYRTSDEWGQLLGSLLHLQKLDLDAITGIAIACVVPPLESVLERTCLRYFAMSPLFISCKSSIDLKILYEQPSEVGADRIVNAIAANDRHGFPSIIIDFGTATTFDAVNERGEYIGGVICPGINISTNALFEKAAKLPRIDLKRPEKVIGKTTVHSMRAGLYYGYLEQVNGIIARMKKEMTGNPIVIVTGGLSGVFIEDMERDVILDSTLTLEGIRIVYYRNRT